MDVLSRVDGGQVVENGVGEQEVFLVLALVDLFCIQLTLHPRLTPALAALAHRTLALPPHVAVVLAVFRHVTLHLLL